MFLHGRQVCYTSPIPAGRDDLRVWVAGISSGSRTNSCQITQSSSDIIILVSVVVLAFSFKQLKHLYYL